MNMESGALRNRLLKNQKRLKTYLNNNQIEVYRIYNKDIPEYPFLIDIYGNHAVIYEQGKKLNDNDTIIRERHLNDIENVIYEIFGIAKTKQHFKTRQIQKGKSQYLKESESQNFIIINEHPFKFLVNFERYLDTGLFLDHRPLRQFLFNNCKDKKVLNLFCYTGPISVAAAMGGGNVTSIDMSATYLDWAYENFKLNDLNPKDHIFYQADVLKELNIRKEKGEKYDIIVLDPPTFSNSKRMEEDLDVERDHPILIRDCMNLLSENGTLYFSTNKRKFELHRIVTDQYHVKEITQWTIPMDFHHTQIHRSFSITLNNK